VLALRRQALGDDNIDVARAHRNLGVLLSRQGRHPDALAEQRRALAITERALGPEHVQVAASLEEVANVLEKLGRSAEALPMRERALAVRERVFGPDHASLTTPVGNLAYNLLEVEQLDRALEQASRALLLADDPAVIPVDRAYVRLVLACVLSQRGDDPARVRDLFERAQAAVTDQEAPTERELLAELAERHGWELTLGPPPSQQGATP
jgi:tetratricopeptide (TPR) repeat protein